MSTVESAFSSHSFSGDVSGQSFKYRVLKMHDSLFIYIGKKDEELLSGLGLGFPSRTSDQESVSMSIINTEAPESVDLAKNISQRLKKPVFVSCNTLLDRISRPVIEKRLLDELNNHPDRF
ncbi:CLUMA_CG013203, isoform A [Clunio marinus]|uniref:CLUMA_CG013203, isoform A n=1 Tax=Clunio marinus TaxID=568069 RepID=A0A1J1IK29_9DIPT|nr:CLUMA_CG013203, isoform A [Clunio marinus]